MAIAATVGIGGCYLTGGSEGYDAGGGASKHADGGSFAFGDASFTVDAGVQQSAPSELRPTFPATVTAADPPPPISGGTLLVTADGRFAVMADPDRDAVYVVDLGARTLAYTVALQKGDEPGRLAEDGAGRVHVALRGGRALATIDVASGTLVARRNVCPAPRGVAWEPGADRVWVACATGELVAFPASGGAATKRFTVERDLRDVVFDQGSLTVSELRSAQLLRISPADGTVARRDPLVSPVQGTIPHVAWRTVAGPAGSVVVVHQAETTLAIPTQQPGAYGGGCGNSNGPPPLPDIGDPDGGVASSCVGDDAGEFDAGCGTMSPVVASVISVVAGDGSIVVNRAFPGAVPVDVAVARDGSDLAVVAPGNAFVKGLGTVFWMTACGDITRPPATVGELTSTQPIAVAFDAAHDLLVQTREPAVLWILDATTQAATPIALSNVSRADTGHDIFHTQASAMIACASCHPEGGDDGHTWMLDGNKRRTPSLRGTIAGTAPYHWPGDKPDLAALVDDVYSSRMSGALLPQDEKCALEGWVQTIQAPPSPSWLDASAVQRGHALFVSPATGCGSCHSGDKLTNNLDVDVGTGGAFQVPSLIGVGWRTPLQHDGCAATMADRFGKCATPKHGATGSLTPQNIADLSAYLEAL